MHAKTHYLVRWKGFSNAENTWEPLANLHGVADMITEFNTARRRVNEKGTTTTSKGIKGPHDQGDQLDTSKSAISITTPKSKTNKKQDPTGVSDKLKTDWTAEQISALQMAHRVRKLFLFEVFFEKQTSTQRKLCAYKTKIESCQNV